MRCIGYARVSTDYQVQTGLGLEGQAEAIAAHAAKLGAELVGPYLDAGVSGGAPLDKRTGLLDAINDLEKGDILLVAKLDRLSRGDEFETAGIYQLVKRRGARVVSAAGEGTDDNSPQGQLIQAIMRAFATFEKALIGSRTRVGMAGKKRRGEVYATVPYGKKVDGQVERLHRGELKQFRTLADDPAELAILATIADLADQGWSVGRIAKELQALGHPTRSGRPWARSTVFDLMQRIKDEREKEAGRQAATVHLRPAQGAARGIGDDARGGGDGIGGESLPDHPIHQGGADDLARDAG